MGFNPTVGDVLVSLSPSQDGRQLIWERFPGRNGETTLYLFYYDRAEPQVASKQSLLDLYEHYFTLLPLYHDVDLGVDHLKPVFGYIPARHGRTGRTAARGLLCLGDSAAGQSPLTFCGFGSFVRHIGRVAMLIDFALRHDLLEERDLQVISPHQTNLRVAWAFSRFMQPWPGSDPKAVNRLMNVFCRGLKDLSVDTVARFLQDRYSFTDYARIMLSTARHYPRVFPLAARVLGPVGLLKWAIDLAAFACWDFLRAGYRMVGTRRWLALERVAGSASRRLALKLMALRTGWQALQ
jgi:lycopene cyclase CruA